MSVNMLVQMREWPPTTPRTVLWDAMGGAIFFCEEKGLERKDRTLTELMLILGVLKASPSLCFGIQTGRQLLTW